MALPYKQALERIEHYCSTFAEALGDASLSVEVRVSLRERRDYWHVIGSRIRRRMEREAKSRHQDPDVAQTMLRLALRDK